MSTCSLRIDRHRPVVGAEHHPVGAEHLDRLAHMRRPEAHRVDVKQREILARQFACSGSTARSGMPSQPSRQPKSSRPMHRQQPAAHVRDHDLQPRDSGRTGRTGSCARAPSRCRTAGRPARRACTGPSAARARSARAADGGRPAPAGPAAHSQNGKASSPSRKRPCQLEQISRPLKPSGAEAALAFGDLVRVERVERAEPQLPRRARDDPGDLVVDRLDDVDRRDFSTPRSCTSAANGVEMMRPVMPALAQTSCCRSKSYIS